MRYAQTLHLRSSASQPPLWSPFPRAALHTKRYCTSMLLPYLSKTHYTQEGSSYGRLMEHGTHGIRRILISSRTLSTLSPARSTSLARIMQVAPYDLQPAATQRSIQEIGFGCWSESSATLLNVDAHLAGVRYISLMPVCTSSIIALVGHFSCRLLKAVPSKCKCFRCLLLP